MLQAICKGAVFGWGQAATLKVLHDADIGTRTVREIASGGAGGFVQGLFMSPLLLLKTRVVTNPHVSVCFAVACAFSCA